MTSYNSVFSHYNLLATEVNGVKILTVTPKEKLALLEASPYCSLRLMFMMMGTVAITLMTFTFMTVMVVAAALRRYFIALFVNDLDLSQRILNLIPNRAQVFPAQRIPFRQFGRA